MNPVIDIPKEIRSHVEAVKAYTDHLVEQWAGPQAWHLLASIGSLDYFKLLGIAPPRVLNSNTMKQQRRDENFQAALKGLSQETKARWAELHRVIGQLKEKRARENEELHAAERELQRLRTSIRLEIEERCRCAELEAIRAKRQKLESSFKGTAFTLPSPCDTGIVVTIEGMDQDELARFRKWKSEQQAKTEHVPGIKIENT